MHVPNPTIQTCWTWWQFKSWNVGNTLEVIVASIAEMSGSKTKEHSNRATVAALVLQKVCAMLRTHLGSGNITARPTHQLCWVILLSHLCITACLPSIISLKHCISCTWELKDAHMNYYVNTPALLQDRLFPLYQICR